MQNIVVGSDLGHWGVDSDEESDFDAALFCFVVVTLREQQRDNGIVCDC